MTTAIAQTPATLPGFGASAFKDLILKNTRKAFYTTLVILLLFGMSSCSYRYIENWMFPPPQVVRVKLAKVSLDMLAPPPSENQDVPPPPPPTVVPPVSGPAVRAGMPVAVPDALLPEDLKDFATVKDINVASAVGGDGSNFGDFASNIGHDVGTLNIQTKEEEPNVEDFIAVEKEPDFDYAALQRRVKYPELALKNGIEGQVLVAALVGKDGRVEKTQIIDSENEILNASAVNAVKETIFTPAVNNGVPVRVWVRIPIAFKLR